MRWGQDFWAWYLGRTARERLLLALMSLLLLGFLAWFAVARPLILGLDSARERHLAAVQRNGEVLAQVAQLRSAPAPTRTSGAAPLALRVTDAAARAGVQLSANEARGAGSVTITVAAAPPTSTLGWLRQLEASGIQIRELTITPQGQGQVAISATLADGSGA